MACVGPVFFDSSVLVGGLIDADWASAAARRALDQVAEGAVPEPLTAWHCCLEVYSVLSRLPVEFRLPPEQVVRLLTAEIMPLFRVCQLPRDSFSPLLDTAVAEAAVGGRIYDVHIAEVARHAGARIVVTANRRHFISLLPYGIRVLTPEEFVGDEGP